LKILKVETLRKMTLLKRKNSIIRLRNEPYLFINIFFAGVIMLIFVYSAVFSPDKDNFPVTCIHEKITGEQCISCGLSHSFSLIVRGRISEAYLWNMYGMRVFLFFASQLAIRVIFSVFYLRNSDTRRQLIITDCIGSGLIFFIAFWPYLSKIISDLL
jgi:hypothetical protein